MDSVLIVSSSEKGKELLKELMTFQSYNKIITADTGNEARRLLIEKDFDLCIINAPLKDEFGDEFAINIASRGISQVMLIIKNEMADEVSEKVEEFGVFVVPKPINRQFFWSALKLMNAAHNRLMSLQSKNVQLQKKIDDIKFIDRAKCLLIQTLKITEEEAHRAIEKRAMDMRITKKEVAAEIMRKYGKQITS